MLIAVFGDAGWVFTGVTKNQCTQLSTAMIYFSEKIICTVLEAEKHIYDSKSI
jgi:hypothetical protein